MVPVADALVVMPGPHASAAQMRGAACGGAVAYARVADARTATDECVPHRAGVAMAGRGSRMIARGAGGAEDYAADDDSDDDLADPLTARSHT